MGRIEPGSEINLNVRLQLTRLSNFSDRDYFHLEITDRASVLQIGTIKISIEAFADMMSMTSTDGTMEYYRNNKNIGKQLETQKVALPVTEWDIREVRKEAKKWEADHEAEGWKIDNYDLDTWNSHLKSDLSYCVTARRWVEMEKN